MKFKNLDELRDAFKSVAQQVVQEEIAPLREQQTEWMKEIFSSRKSFGQEEDRPKGTTFTRIVRALAAAKGDPDRAANWARKNWDDEVTAKALGSNDASAGGFLVPAAFSTEMIELLTPRAVVRSLGPVTVPMPNGTLSMPKLTGGSTATYVGENQNITITEPTTGQVNLVWKKLAAIVPVSNDLLRYSDPSADTVVRDDLVTQMANREDLAFIRGDGAADTPTGFRNLALAGQILTETGAATLANMTTDLGRLWLQLAEANVPFTRPGWIMAPREFNHLMSARDGNGNFGFRTEMQGGTLMGYPFRTTTQVPVNLGGGSESEIYLIDFGQILLGESPEIVIDASDSAAYWDGSAVQAAFSRDQTLIRAISRHDIGTRHDEGIALISDATWFGGS